MDETSRNTSDANKGIAQPAKPGRLFLVGSFIVYALCIVLPAVAIAFLSEYDVSVAVISSTLLVIPILTLGLSQYYAISHRSVQAARLVEAFLNGAAFLFFIFTTFGVVTTADLIYAQKGVIRPSRLGLYAILLAMALLCVLQGEANRRWINLLRRERRAMSMTPPRFQFSIREMLGLTTVVAMIAGLTMTIIKYGNF